MSKVVDMFCFEEWWY